MSTQCCQLNPHFIQKRHVLLVIHQFMSRRTQFQVPQGWACLGKHILQGGMGGNCSLLRETIAVYQPPYAAAPLRQTYYTVLRLCPQ